MPATATAPTVPDAAATIAVPAPRPELSLQVWWEQSELERRLEAHLLIARRVAR